MGRCLVSIHCPYLVIASNIITIGTRDPGFTMNTFAGSRHCLALSMNFFIGESFPEDVNTKTKFVDLVSAKRT